MMSIGKVVKKVTSIVLVVAMIMTSAGIQTFASSVDDVVNAASEERGNENLNRKYYDELINEENENAEEKVEEVEEEKVEEEKVGEENSQEKENLEEKGPSENSDEGSDESEETITGDEEEPEEDETSKSSEEEPEVDETTVTPTEETESSSISDAENEDNNNEENNEEDIIEENIASESDASDDADTTDEAEEEKNEDAVASSSDVEEVNEEKAYKVATYSEIFTVATGSEVDLATDREIPPADSIEMVATDSELDKELGGFDWHDRWVLNAPGLLVFGDIGYYTAHSGRGYIGFYLGRKDFRYKKGKTDHRVTEEYDEYTGGWDGGDEGGGMNLSTKMMLRAANNTNYFNGKKWWENEWAFMKVPDARSDITDSDDAWRSYQPAPQYRKEVSWYVKAAGNFEAQENYFENGGILEYDGIKFAVNGDMETIGRAYLPLGIFCDRETDSTPRNQLAFFSTDGEDWRNEVLGWQLAKGKSSSLHLPACIKTTS